MKKKKVALALIFLILAIMAVMAAAYFTVYFWTHTDDMGFITMADGVNSCVVIHSPVNGGLPFQTSSINILLDYYVPKNLTQVNSFTYSLNGQSNATLNWISSQTSYSGYRFSYPYVDYSISKPLRNLANADYELTVYAHFVNGTAKSIYDQPFTVDTNFVPPKLTIISPENQSTYNTNEVPITYYINAKVVYSYYALDTSDVSSVSAWTYFKGNITLSGLSEGSHKLIISVNSEAKGQTSPINLAQTIYFNVRLNK